MLINSGHIISEKKFDDADKKRKDTNYECQKKIKATNLLRPLSKMSKFS